MILMNRGVSLSGLYIDPFWNFLQKIRRTLFGMFLCLMEVSKYDFAGCFFGEKWLSFSKDFLNILDF